MGDLTMVLATLLLLSMYSPPATPTSETNKASSPDEKVVCRSELVLDSRIPIRVCRTQAEWDDQVKQTQEDLNNSRNDRGIAPND
jgi:hypothetical protein